MRLTYFCIAALASGPLAAASGPQDAPPAASTTLELAPRKLDLEGSKAAGMMYMPSSVKLSAEKPAEVKKEPAYRGKPMYAVITLGNGSPDRFAIAFDEPEGADAHIYPDLNGNGDLTDDGVSTWEKVKKETADHGAEFSGTYVFKVRWNAADGKATAGDYGLNVYRSAGRDSVNYYRAAARTGSIKVEGKDYEAMLLENDNDALFNKPFDPNKPVVVGEPMGKPIWLVLDGNQYDIRGTFQFADLNFLATVSDDGSRITLTPTMKVVRLPRGPDRPPMLPAGGEAPEFEAIAWKPDQKEQDRIANFKLSDFRGKKVVVLDMWATWCGPCMKGIPHLAKLAETAKGQDVVFLALNVYDDPPAFEKFAKGKGKGYSLMLARDPAGRESDASIAKRLYRVSGIPATYVIDKSGKIVAAISGYNEGDKELEGALKGLGIKLD